MRKKIAAIVATIVFCLGGCESKESHREGAHMNGARIVDSDKIQIELEDRSISETIDVSITNAAGDEIGVSSVKRNDDDLIVNTEEPLLPNERYTIDVNGERVETQVDWQFLDRHYTYDGNDLGATVHDDGTATLKIWAPTAEKATVTLFDKSDAERIVREGIQMEQSENGIWEVHLNEQNTNIGNVSQYYYQYQLTHYGKTHTVLDPYAKSMAAFDSNGDDPVGKAAIVDPATIGPELEFADIDGFEKRDDAIIWEVHVRDLTSDPFIEEKLESRFGTYDAFVERLDYVQELGVTHVQLLPIMKYYFGDEFSADQREMEYASNGSNYNWGYDPHSYFTPSGMYSANPTDPELRIEEVKRLIDEIHKRGMGVIVDVVYNHTAQMSLFEDVVPHYYHFLDGNGQPKESYGGGALASTRVMTQKLIIDSLLYWTEEFKVDGFRFDLMGAHDAATIEEAYQQVAGVNPNTLMIGEGWRLYDGDDGIDEVPADQDWMKHTDSVGVFSDDFRNELKSGVGIEGEPRFTTGGKRDIATIFANIKAQPSNFEATSPRDVVQYIEAHDDLTNHDMIALSIKKDPDGHQKEIQRRIRLGHAILLTSQGTAFLHAGQEYGRTKQWLGDHKPEGEYTYMEDENGAPFAYPYFINDSYDSSDAINRFDWAKVQEDGMHKQTVAYTKGLIELRKSSNAFRLGEFDIIDQNVLLVEAPEVNNEDVLIGYELRSTDSTGTYYVFVNGDDKERSLTLDVDLSTAQVLVDRDQAGIEPIYEPAGVMFDQKTITLAPLTAVVVKAQ